MTSSGYADLSASLYVGGHTFVARSRVFMKSDEITMGSEVTGFIQEMMTETGKNTVVAISETEYRGGRLFTVILKTT